MKSRFLVSLCVGTAVAFWTSNLGAYESYHDPNLNDAGYCSDCHPGFSGGKSDTTHSLHTGNPDAVTGECDFCHTGSGRDNPFTMWSTGDGTSPGLGCAGCHGRDYGRDIELDYRGFSLTGLAKNSSFGLRQHHLNSSNYLNHPSRADLCSDCHDDAGDTVVPENDLAPVPELVLLPLGNGSLTHYYERTDKVELGGSAVDMCTNEDTANDGDALGLDNDGDLTYEGADTDCIAAPPEDCSNGFDDDGDLDIDCDDAECTGDPACGCTADPDCDNGLFCDGAETCNVGTGDCEAGTPPVVDDGVGCTDDSCDEIGDVVVNAPNDGLCDNGLFCDGAETCDAVLDCQGGTPPVVDDGVGCTDDSCDEVGDVVVNAPNDGLCDNGLFCDGAETCDAVLDCQGGTPPVVDDGVGCTDDSCDEVGDVVVNAPNDGLCDNGLFCDGSETCDAVLDCQGGTPPVVDDGVGCTDDSCDEIGDVVVNTPNDGLCDNGQFCDGSETCDAVLDCQGGTPPVVDDGVGCTDDSCDEIGDVVVNTPNDGLCDNGLFCDGSETCDAVLDCQGGTPPVVDDGVGCTDDSCDEVGDVVVNAPNDGLCDNGLFCDGSETCDAVLDCQGGTPPVVDDGVGCTDDSCDEVGDVVVNAPNDGLCDNGQFCDGSETCDAVLDCQAGTPPVVDDGVGCTDDSCDEIGDVVVNTPNDGLCDNGQFCDGSETCDAVLDCQGGAPPVVNDGVGCTDDSCDEVGDVVVNAPNDGLCDNGLFCDGAETCDAVLDCQGGTPPVVDDGVGCTDDSCDEVGDVVVNAPNDGLCDNGLFCDGAETCDAVLDCQAGTPPVVDDGVGCTDDSCDEIGDVVVNTPNDGLCDNGLFCDGSETCDAVLDCQAGIDPCGLGPACDEDDDLVCDDVDNCPTVANGPQVDADSDGSGDVCDNCAAIANGPTAYAPGLAAVSQCDRDSDGYGNACDGDFDQNGFVTPTDSPLYTAALALFFPPPPGEHDMDCNGFMTPLDSPIYVEQLAGFFPGPSGWSCAGTVPCPAP